MDPKIPEKYKELLQLYESLYIKKQDADKKMKKMKSEREIVRKKREDFEMTKLANDHIIAENKERFRRSNIRVKMEHKMIGNLLDESKVYHEKVRYLRQRKYTLMKQCKYLKKYDSFILDSFNYLPTDYFVPPRDVEKVINRYESLDKSLGNLGYRFTSNSFRIQFYFNQFVNLRDIQYSAMLRQNGDLMKLYLLSERVREKLRKEEIDLIEMKNVLREKIMTLGITIRSLDNITRKCIARKNMFFKSPQKDESNFFFTTITEKTSIIKQFLYTSRGILELMRLL